MKHHIEAIIFTAPECFDSSSDDPAHPVTMTMGMVRRERLVSYEDTDELKRKVNELYFGIDNSETNDVQKPPNGSANYGDDDDDDDNLELRITRTYSSTSTNPSLFDDDHDENDLSVSTQIVNRQQHHHQNSHHSSHITNPLLHHSPQPHTIDDYSSELQYSAIAALTAATAANPLSAYSLSQASHRLHHHHCHHQPSGDGRARCPDQSRRGQHQPYYRNQILEHQRHEEELTWRARNSHQRRPCKGPTIHVIPLPSLFCEDSRDCSNNEIRDKDKQDGHSVQNDCLRDVGVECSIPQQHHDDHDSLPLSISHHKDADANPVNEDDKNIFVLRTHHETRCQNTAVMGTELSVNNQQKPQGRRYCPRSHHEHQRRIVMKSTPDPLDEDPPISTPHASSYFVFGCLLLQICGGGSRGDRGHSRSTKGQQHEHQQQQQHHRKESDGTETDHKWRNQPLTIVGSSRGGTKTTSTKIMPIRAMLSSMFHRRRDWQIREPQPQHDDEMKANGHCGRSIL